LLKVTALDVIPPTFCCSSAQPPSPLFSQMDPSLRSAQIQSKDLACEANDSNVIYKGSPSLRPVATTRLCFHADQCGVRIAPHGVIAAELVISGATLRVSLDSPLEAQLGYPRHVCLVPTLVAQRLSPASLLLRDALPEELEFHFTKISVAADAEQAINVTVRDVGSSLFAPLVGSLQLSVLRQASANDVAIASAFVIYSTPLWQAPLYALRFAELRTCGFAAELCIFSSADRSETLAVITITRCSTVLHVHGGCSITIKERKFHNLVLPCPGLAQCWAELLQYTSTKFVLSSQSQDASRLFKEGLVGRARQAEAASKLWLESLPTTCVVAHPMLARAELADCVDEANTDLSTLRQSVGLGLQFDGFDIAEVLAEQCEEGHLPPSSDTCQVCEFEGPHPSDTCHVDLIEQPSKTNGNATGTLLLW